MVTIQCEKCFFNGINFWGMKDLRKYGLMVLDLWWSLKKSKPVLGRK